MATITAPMCPIHGDTADLMSDAVIYGTQFGMVWKCRADGCDYRVGAHRDSNAPKGTMANGSTREARKRAHAVFDGWWKRQSMKRGEAYRELLARTGISHIGESSVDECQRVIDAFTKPSEDTR
jgi:hypothetical protein